MLQAARGGGRITPRFAMTLQKHVRDGRLEIPMNTTIVAQDNDEDSQAWTLTTNPPTPELPSTDYIYFATGVQSDISTLLFLHRILDDGLPAVTDDLAWSENVTGKFAGLRLGPGAANLEGARAGAERITLAVEGLLARGDLSSMDRKRDSGYERIREGGMKERYVSGMRSMFEGLEVEG